ncbi:unnamed protein product [Closterium sp. NIES-65]|nr:unnamed protein product [Closterium sp. NIES-65]
MLPYLFPDLAAFPTVADLITHLRTSDTRYRAALPTEFCAKNPPPMYITLYYIVTRLPDSLRIVRDHFLSVCPTTLTVDLLDKGLLAAEKSIFAVGASRGDPRTPVFEGRSALRLPLAGDAAPARACGARALKGLAGAVEVVVEAVEGVRVVVGVVAGVAAAAASVEAEEVAVAAEGAEVAEETEVEDAVEAAAAVVDLVAALRRGVAPVVVRASSSRAVMRPCPLSSYVSGTLRVSAVGVRVPAPTAGVAIFDLDFDAILAAMYAVDDSVVGDCYLCVPLDPGIEATAPGAGEAAALGASASAAHGAGESALSDRTTLTPLSRPDAVSLADPSGGPFLASFSTVLPLSFGTTALVTPPCLVSEAWPPVSLSLVSLGLSLPYLRGVALPASPASRGDSAPPLTPLSFLRQRLRCRLSTWMVGPRRVSGRVVGGAWRYFLLVFDDYSHYTTVFPLRSKGDVTEVGGELSSARLGAFCRAQGIRQTFTIPASPQQNGIAEHRIGMVMDVARTSMMHAAAPHFLWPLAVQYAAHQLNLQPRVSLPETSPALRWTEKVGDASAFWVWGSRAFVRDLSADKLSPRAVPCVFLGFPPDPPGWQFYHPTSRRPPPVNPLPRQGRAPLGVSKVDAIEPVEVAVDSGAARGTEPAGAGSGGAESGGAETGGAEPGAAGSWVAETGGAEPGGARSRGAEPGSAGSARVAVGGASSSREPLSPQELREWFARCLRHAAAIGGAAGATAGTGGGRLLELTVLLELVLLELELLGVLALVVLLALVLLRVVELALVELEVLLALVLRCR